MAESVKEAVRVELEGLDAVSSVEGQVALNLAAILDDRAGIQGGGVASTAKQLTAVMESLRALKPKGKTKLEFLRGGASA